MTELTDDGALALLANEEGYDPIEDRLRAMVRQTIETMFEEELAGALGRGRYARGGKAKGYRNGHRDRELVGTFGRETVRVPRARIEGGDGRAREWRSKALPRYRRLTKKAEALIASVYLSGTNTRRVKRALFALFEGAVSKDVVSRAWRKVKVDWDAWCARSLADEDIVRLILDGTVVRTRIDKRATNVSVLAAIGVRRDGQKVLLSIRNMGGESTAAWSSFLGDLDARGLCRPEFVIVDGAPGLEAALAQLWGEDLPIQRCTVHKHRNLLAHAPKHLHEEIGADYRDMIYAETAREVMKRRQAFLRKWRLRCRAVADSLEEAGDRLFTFTRLDPSQWKAARTTNAIERLNEEFRRRIKTQTVLPAPETVPMLLWALLASGQIQMRKVDGWETLHQPLEPAVLDAAA
ncbi:MAG: IS256 family transposase [Halothiobacillaceae bacterium]